jgi:hypothetical protein
VLPLLLARDDTTDIAALRAEQASLAERKDKAALMFASGEIDAAQLAVQTKYYNERGRDIATTLAQTGWHSPLEPLAGGDISTLWEPLSMAHKRAILAVLADIHVLPIPPTTRGFNPAGGVSNGIQGPRSATALGRRVLGQGGRCPAQTDAACPLPAQSINLPPRKNRRFHFGDFRETWCLTCGNGFRVQPPKIEVVRGKPGAPIEEDFHHQTRRAAGRAL